jgi:D-alanyl-lipoteichoic acid acyltransferase DltB (MBOAT superfamily)
MLFSSHVFIFVFLPAALAGFFLIGRIAPKFTAAWLVAASLFFYAWWAPVHLIVLTSSILFNYAVGVELAGTSLGGRYRGRLLATAIAVNLCLLGYFKYAEFMLGSLAPLLEQAPELPEIDLPLGISFFTFTQIAYLVDVHRNQARDYKLVHYGLFVTYFPHLIAGPILHHREMMPQFDLRASWSPKLQDIAVGLTFFAIGLFKKVMIADNGLAPHANAVFSVVAQDAALPLFESWIGAIAFGLQIYFDFSGYSDMAIGLSLLFGIRLPVNFHSPYKAESIIDFWRRWHMTLSRFLREYLYIPLGGNRGGRLARYRNVLLTMLLGGLWHGAAWHFVLWGGLHGIYIVVNHAWRKRFAEARRPPGTGARVAGWLLTFTAVTVAWVFFRADGMAPAVLLLKGMVGMHGVALPVDAWTHWDIVMRGAQSYRASVWVLVLVTALVAFVRLAPNSQQVMARFDIALPNYPQDQPGFRWYHWRLTPLAGLAAGILLAVSIAKFNDVTPFLYFQF